VAVDGPAGAVGGRIQESGERKDEDESDSGEEGAVSRMAEIGKGLRAEEEGGEGKALGMDPDREAGEGAGGDLSDGPAAQEKTGGEDGREDDEQVVVGAVEGGVSEGWHVQEQRCGCCCGGGRAGRGAQRPEHGQGEKEGREALDEAGAEQEGLARLQTGETERPGGGEEEPGGRTGPLQRDPVGCAVAGAPVERRAVEEMRFEDGNAEEGVGVAEIAGEEVVDEEELKGEDGDAGDEEGRDRGAGVVGHGRPSATKVEG
jgi:hypothetical protein